jgi:hypothetical protein
MPFDVAACGAYLSRPARLPPHALPASRSETKGSPSPTNRILPYRTYMDRYMDGTTKQQALFPTAYHTYSICGPWNKVFKVQLGFLRGAQCATATGSIPTGFGPPHWHRSVGDAAKISDNDGVRSPVKRDAGPRVFCCLSSYS